MLGRLLSTEGRGVLWLVAEDAAAPSPDVSQLLSESGVPHVHLAFGPARSGGNAQRNVALKYIRDRRLSGVVRDDMRWRSAQRRADRRYAKAYYGVP